MTRPPATGEEWPRWIFGAVWGVPIGVGLMMAGGLIPARVVGPLAPGLLLLLSLVLVRFGGRRS